MKCVIVAAGRGSRLREKTDSKPLVPLRGIPLIERVIAGARRAGCDEFVVIDGYRGAELRAALAGVADVRHVTNDQWQRANGVSLACAAPHVDGPFVLSMCDHLADPAIIRGLIAGPRDPARVTLAVDFAIDDPVHDPIDATRVACEDGRILRIGKLLPEFDAFDTGLFLLNPIMFAALAESQAAGDDSISGAMGVLAARGQAFVYDVAGAAWIDVDDPADFARAEALVDAGTLA